MNLRPYIIERVSHLCDLILQHLQRYLTTTRKCSTLLSLLIVPIDRKVGQMHESVLDKHRLEAKLLRAQSRKAFFVDKRLKRVEVRDEDIDPHIELVAIKQQRVYNVLLDDYVIGVVEFCEVVDYLYASASRLTDGFHDPIVQVAVHYLLFVEFYAELRELFREVVGQG